MQVVCKLLHRCIVCVSDRNFVRSGHAADTNIPMSKKRLSFNMRFPDNDIILYEEGRKLAQKRRISLAELLRQLLIAELKANGIDTELASQPANPVDRVPLEKQKD